MNKPSSKIFSSLFFQGPVLIVFAACLWALIAVFIDMFLYKTFLAPTQYLAAVVLMFAIYRVGKLQYPSLK